MKTKIKFTTSETREKTAQGQTRYQGQLRHNLVWDESDTRREFASYCGEPESRTNRYLDALTEFIARGVRAGYRLDFGGFATSLKLRGSFKSANAPFDSEVNTISVELTPGKAVKRAVASLCPVNMTEDRAWTLSHTLQKEPIEVYDQLARDGVRVVTTGGHFPKVHPEASDEGVWVEDDLGNRLLTGVVTESGFAYVDYTLTGSLPRGLHWVVAQARNLPDPALIRARRRVTVL